MPNIRISDLETIAPGFDPDAVFVEVQNTVDGEPASRKATVTELTAQTSPLDATYVTVTANAILPNERILTGSASIDVVDGGAGGNITISVSAAAAAYFNLSATGRVIGSDAGTSNTGDNVFLGGSLAGDVNIADGVIAIGQNAFAAAAQTDFRGSIAIGRNAGALMDDTRDPWIIIGDGAAALLPGQSFHDANTIIGTNALGAMASQTIQQTTIIGHDACSDMTGASGLGTINSSVVVGSDAGRGNVGASISGSVIIGRDACGDMGVGGVNSSVCIGQAAGESFGGANLAVVIGSSALQNAVNADTCIVIGCNTAAFGVSQTEAQILIGHSAFPGLLTGEKNILIGNSLGINGSQIDFDGSVIIGQGAGNNMVDDQDIFAIEVPQGGTSNVSRPFLFGNFLNGNLALLNIASLVGGIESGARIVPAWADAAPTAGQGVFSMYGAGTDLAATTDDDFVHFFVASADSTLTLRYPLGGDVTLLHDGSDAIIQTNIIVGPVADGKLFINTTTGAQDAQGSSIVSATPDKISIFAAGSATNGVDGANVEIWAGYAAGLDPANGGDVGIWGGGGGGGPAVGGNVRLFGGEADASPGDVFLIGGTATVGGDGGGVDIQGAPGFGTGARDGGGVSIAGGAGVDTAGIGGSLGITGGAGSGTGFGGNITITAGPGVSANGGIVNITGGSVVTSGAGGRVQIVGGDGGAASDAGGDVWILVGSGNAVGHAGNIYFNTTDGVTPDIGVTTNAVGNIVMFGIGGNSIDGGDILITAGQSSLGATGDGGDILLEGGSTTATNGDGGDVFLTVGLGNGSGLNGEIITTGALRALNAAGPAFLDEAATATNPTLIPNRADDDTGIGWAAADQLSMIAGGVEGLRFAELNSGVVQAPAAAVTVTAFAGGGQGSATALIHSYNVITTVATAGDSVRLPSVFAINSLVYIKNDDAAEAADVFPASGDNLGAGVDTAVSLDPGASLTFMATVADSTWTQLIINSGAAVSGEFDNLLLSQTPGVAATPTLRFGDGDTGFFESGDDTLQFASSGVARFSFSGNGILAINTNSFGLWDETATATNPTMTPNRGDDDTGLGWNASDEISIIAGGTEGLRFTELSAGVIQAPSASLSVTAFAGGGQGSATALINSYNVIATVATTGDSVRLPDTFAADSIIYIKNNDSTEAMDVFPASGDDLGAGTNTAVSLAAGESLVFIATVANSTWTPLIVDTAGGGGGADSDGARRSVGVPNATGSYIDYTDIVVSPPSTGFYTVDITLGWSGNDANITGLDLTWSVGTGTIPSSQGTWITTINTAPGGVESTTVDGGTLSGGVMPVADGTVAYVSQFHGIWDVGATLPTDIQLGFRREGSSGTVTGAPNASISIRKFAEL